MNIEQVRGMLLWSAIINSVFLALWGLLVGALAAAEALTFSNRLHGESPRERAREAELVDRHGRIAG